MKKKYAGRAPKYPEALMRVIAEKVASREMTYREASRIYGVSHGAVGSWKRKYTTEVQDATSRTPEIYTPKLSPEEQLKVEAEVCQLMNDIGRLHHELGILNKTQEALLS